MRSVTITRRISVVGVLMAALIAATACSSSKSDAGNGGSGSGCAKKYTLRYGDASPESPDSPVTKTANYFIDQVHTLSHGCITVRHFPNSQLGVSNSLLTGVLTGSIDFAEITTGTVATRDPKFFAYTYPFLAQTHDQLYKIIDSAVGQQILHDLDGQGATGLYLSTGGPFLFATKKQVDSVDDFGGQKIRAYTDPENTDLVTALGAQAVTLDFPQVYSSIQSGVISGVEAGSAALIAGKFSEVAKYVSLLVPDWTTTAMFVSTKVLGKLSADLQSAIKDAAAATAKQAAVFNADTLSGATPALTAAGFKVSTPTDVSAFMAKVASVAAKYDSKIGADVVSQIKQAAST